MLSGVASASKRNTGRASGLIFTPSWSAFSFPPPHPACAARLTYLLRPGPNTPLIQTPHAALHLAKVLRGLPSTLDAPLRPPPAAASWGLFAAHLIGRARIRTSTSAQPAQPRRTLQTHRSACPFSHHYYLSASRLPAINPRLPVLRGGALRLASLLYPTPNDARLRRDIASRHHPAYNI